MNRPLFTSLPLFDAVNLTHVAQQLGSSDFVYLSKRLYKICETHPVDQDGRAIASNFVEAVVCAGLESATFPLILFPHFWHPCVSSIPGDDGRRRLYLTGFDETTEGIALMTAHCFDFCRFHEYVPKGWTRDKSVRTYLSRRLKARCDRVAKCTRKPILLPHLYLAAIDPLPRDAFWWFTHYRIPVSALTLPNEDGRRSVYLMRASESPAREWRRYLPV